MQIKTYTEREMPDAIRWQILDFFRIEWPQFFTGKYAYRDWITFKRYHPVHAVLVEKGVVTTYIGIVWKHLSHMGKRYKLYGLYSLFTYPSFRGKGYGLKLLHFGKRYIEKIKDADAILFTTEMRGYHEKEGFTYIGKDVLREGDRKNPVVHHDGVYMSFLSKKAIENKADFLNNPIYFGHNPW